MIDTIDPNLAIIPYNYVLIKCDPNHDIHEIATPNGSVKLQLSYFNQDKSNYLSISGEVKMMPREKWYFDNKGEGNGDEFTALVRNSLEFDADCDIKIGDKIFFDYREQIDVELERRIVRTEEWGLCILVRLDRIYGVYDGNDLRPVNGYVFFKREQLPDRLELSSGILSLQSHDKYESNNAIVISADKPCRSHLEGEYEGNMELQAGNKIIIDKNRGFRISYDIGNEELRDIELIHRKDIAGKVGVSEFSTRVKYTNEYS